MFEEQEQKPRKDEEVTDVKPLKDKVTITVKFDAKGKSFPIRARVHFIHPSMAEIKVAIKPDNTLKKLMDAAAVSCSVM